jgi:hypothetical protein
VTDGKYKRFLGHILNGDIGGLGQGGIVVKTKNALKDE